MPNTYQPGYPWSMLETFTAYRKDEMKSAKEWVEAAGLPTVYIELVMAIQSDCLEAAADLCHKRSMNGWEKHTDQRIADAYMSESAEALACSHHIRAMTTFRGGGEA